MATAMERAIDALSDPGVSTADALRRLLVVARRGQVPGGGVALWSFGGGCQAVSAGR